MTTGHVWKALMCDDVTLHVTPRPCKNTTKKNGAKFQPPSVRTIKINLGQQKALMVHVLYKP